MFQLYLINHSGRNSYLHLPPSDIYCTPLLAPVIIIIILPLSLLTLCTFTCTLKHVDYTAMTAINKFPPSTQLKSAQMELPFTPKLESEITRLKIYLFEHVSVLTERTPHATITHHVSSARRNLIVSVRAYVLNAFLP